MLSSAKARYAALVRNAAVVSEKLRLERSFAAEMEKERDEALASKASVEARCHRACKLTHDLQERHQHALDQLQV